MKRLRWVLAVILAAAGCRAESGGASKLRREFAQYCAGMAAELDLAVAALRRGQVRAVPYGQLDSDTPTFLYSRFSFCARPRTRAATDLEVAFHEASGQLATDLESLDTNEGRERAAATMTKLSVLVRELEAIPLAR